MKKVSEETKKALKKRIKNMPKTRSGLAAMIAYHPAMARDIGRPILDGRDTCVVHVGKNV